MNETIKQDYFKLIRDLNKSNKTKNESTRLYFYIERNRFYAALSKEQKVLMCEKSGIEWLPSSDGHYTNLEQHIADFLNKNTGFIDLTTEIRLSIFQVFD